MSAEPIIVRRLTLLDKEPWAVLRQALWPDQPVAAHAAEIEAMLAEESARGYGGFDRKESLVAFAEVSVRRYANGCTRTPVPFLEGIFVLDGNRQRGIGARLIAELEKELREEGFIELCSDADIDNEASHSAHRRWGFTETERVVYFRKPLDGHDPPDP